MKLTEFTRVIDHHLEILYPDIDGKFYCSFRRGNLKEGIMLCGAVGRGDTPEQALEAYADRIKGGTIVFGYDIKNRQEFNVPDRFDPEVNE